MYGIEDIDSLPDVSEFTGLGVDFNEIRRIHQALIELENATFKSGKYKVDDNDRITKDVIAKINLALKNYKGWGTVSISDDLTTGKIGSGAITQNAGLIADKIFSAARSIVVANTDIKKLDVEKKEREAKAEVLKTATYQFAPVRALVSRTVPFYKKPSTYVLGLGALAVAVIGIKLLRE